MLGVAAAGVAFSAAAARSALRALSRELFADWEMISVASDLRFWLRS